mgnify:CR=1 FL=1
MSRKKPKLVQVEGLKVTLNNPNAIEAALRAFKKAVKDSQLLYTLKQKQYYKKPSAVKREMRNLAKLRKKYKKDDWFINQHILIYTYLIHCEYTVSKLLVNLN